MAKNKKADAPANPAPVEQAPAPIASESVPAEQTAPEQAQQNEPAKEEVTNEQAAELVKNGEAEIGKEQPLVFRAKVNMMLPTGTTLVIGEKVTLTHADALFLEKMHGENVHYFLDDVE